MQWGLLLTFTIPMQTILGLLFKLIDNLAEENVAWLNWIPWSLKGVLSSNIFFQMVDTLFIVKGKFLPW